MMNNQEQIKYDRELIEMTKYYKVINKDSIVAYKVKNEDCLSLVKSRFDDKDIIEITHKEYVEIKEDNNFDELLNVLSTYGFYGVFFEIKSSWNNSNLFTKMEMLDCIKKLLSENKNFNQYKLMFDLKFIDNYKYFLASENSDIENVEEKV